MIAAHFLASSPPVHGAAGLGGIFLVAFVAALWSLNADGKGKGGRGRK